MTEEGEEEGEEEAEPAPGYLVWPLFLLEAVTPLLQVGLSAPGQGGRWLKVQHALDVRLCSQRRICCWTIST